MALDITITNLLRNTDDVVTTVYWSATLTDSNYSLTATGTQNYEGDANSEGFVAYNNLTEETVKDWLTLDDGMESAMQEQINQQKDDTKTAGLPW